MTTLGLSDDIRRFIASNLRSVEVIDILGLLDRDRSRSWSAAEVAAELRTSPAAAAMRLAHLRSLGFAGPAAEAGERFWFAPRDQEAERMALRVLSAYRELPVTVIQLIFSRPSLSIQELADAFRLKKEREENAG